MRNLISILLVIVVIALIILYFLPGTITIEKNMILKAPSQVVYDHINTPKNWGKWIEWLKQDPVIELTYNGPESGAGAALSWNSQVPDISIGNVLLELSQPPTQVKATIDFAKYGKSDNTFLLQNTGNGTNISWSLDLNAGEKGFPEGWINKIKALSWKGKIESWMEASLKNLDEVTANVIYFPGQSATDSLSYKVDSLAAKIDSLKRLKLGKDTIYIDTLNR